MNKVVIYGRIGKLTPETININGEAVKKIKFSIADNVDKKTTIWHNVVAWRGTAQTIENYCKVGDRLLINGQISSFKNVEGKEYQYITCTDITFIEGKSEQAPAVENEDKPF